MEPGEGAAPTPGGSAAAASRTAGAGPLAGLPGNPDPADGTAAEGAAAGELEVGPAAAGPAASAASGAIAAAVTWVLALPAGAHSGYSLGGLRAGRKRVTHWTLSWVFSNTALIAGGLTCLRTRQGP